MPLIDPDRQPESESAPRRRARSSRSTTKTSLPLPVNEQPAPNHRPRRRDGSDGGSRSAWNRQDPHRSRTGLASPRARQARPDHRAYGSSAARGPRQASARDPIARGVRDRPIAFGHGRTSYRCREHLEARRRLRPSESARKSIDQHRREPRRSLVATEPSAHAAHRDPQTRSRNADRRPGHGTLAAIAYRHLAGRTAIRVDPRVRRRSAGRPADRLRDEIRRGAARCSTRT